MNPTASADTSIAMFALWGGSSRCGCPDNPTNASTRMEGGKVCFENDNYTITMGDDNTVTIHNKHTGECYEAWGDPHMKVDGQQAFDFWGTTTLQLDDGTKVTIQTTPWAANGDMTLASKVTITNGDYGVQVSGIDTNTAGDLKFDETSQFGGLLDAVTGDGNTLYENARGKGFVGLDGGQLRAVDQQYINETDLKKGGALKQRFDEALLKMAGLLAVSFVGGFLLGAAAAMRRDDGDGCHHHHGHRDSDFDGLLMLSMGRSHCDVSWMALALRA